MTDQRYRATFEHAPVALWEGDCTEVSSICHALEQRGITDFTAHFAAHPAFTVELASRIAPLDVNRAAHALYRAPDRDALMTSIDRLLAPRSEPALVSLLAAIARSEYARAERPIGVPGT